MVIARYGRDGIPIGYAGWSVWRYCTKHPERCGLRDPRWLAELAPAPCGYCWGAGRIKEPARNSEGLVWADCPSCLGLRTMLT